MVNWQGPPEGWVCLNTDGAVNLSEGTAAAGGILRRHDGRFIRAFAANLGGGSITHAELTGIVHGLRLAWDSGARKIEIQTDSVTAVHLIQSGVDMHPHHALIAEARRLIELDWEVKVKHVFRESNFTADYLASLGQSLQIGVQVIDNPSPTLNYWMFFDVMGVQTPRLVNV
ncbi:unnamed protein product [Linum tenue]|uniref:RNase H type-1 domain-containing protein n=1 Tax=Linum tenue TaxID=586396 RepID=A0AAV0NVE2_9ROSI|nr:unnamed protein product [Linum tenue]